VSDLAKGGTATLGPAEEGSTEEAQDLDKLEEEQQTQQKIPRKQRDEGERKRTYSNKGRL
jgi:hypothetical protein